MSTIPGIVIDHIPAHTQQYIGSPSILAIGDDHFLASHDIFGPGSTYDTTRVFESADGGHSWRQISEIRGLFWANLFEHNGAFYLMGTSKRFGALVIRRSDDDGATWTEARDARSGVIREDGMYHTAPMPMVVHNGRIWRAFEDMYPELKWGVNFRAFILSAPEDGDLLCADSWAVSNRLASDGSWLDGGFGGWLEGNAVITPDGRIADVLRADFRPCGGKAAVIHADHSGTSLTFDPARDFIDFPGGCKKFTIRRDEMTGTYWSLSNHVPVKHAGGNPERTRNTLSLLRSDNLREWEVRATVLYHPDTETHGFQYVDWQFLGSDIIVVSRTAFDDDSGGAHNQHDANYMTFHRVVGFRTATGDLTGA